MSLNFLGLIWSSLPGTTSWWVWPLYLGKGQDTHNITTNKVRARSLEGNLVVIHHIYTPLVLSDGAIFSHAVTLICNGPGRRTEGLHTTRESWAGGSTWGGKKETDVTLLENKGHCAHILRFFFQWPPWNILLFWSLEPLAICSHYWEEALLVFSIF